jgi:hypothetical protein
VSWTRFGRQRDGQDRISEKAIETGGVSKMADINKFSEQVIDLAERLANVADAAKGKDTKTMKPKARWVLLPAAGAGIYALTTSRAFTRQAKTVVNEAKARASDLPDELVSRVHEATGSANGRSNRPKPTTRTSGRSAGQRRRKASASR